MTDPAEPTAAPAPPPPIPEPREYATTHAGDFHGRHVAYRCVAGDMYLPDADGAPRASVFSFSYIAETETPARPVIFVFNGGPGSASLWLHMGALGPRIIRVPGDGTSAGSGPYDVEDNALCCLDLADLVFIDPPGTGYSRMVGAAKQEDAWGLDADAEIVAAFVKAWLTRHKRWASPRFLCGESYGTTRAVAVAGKLSGNLGGAAFNGIALVSMILDFHTARFERGNPSPDVCFLPTYAATALYHGRSEAPDGREAFLDAVRRFATEEYLPALFAASRLAPETAEAVRAKLAACTGLSQAWLARTRGKIDPARFRKELLRERGLTVGRFDSRYTGVDYDEAGEMPDADPSSYAIDSAFVTAANDHLTRDLGIDWDRPYMPFNRDALLKWDWHGPRKDDTPRWPGYVNVAPTLGRLLRENPALRVLVANGIYDLATPFFAAEITLAGNGIPPGRVRMTYYDAGHMMYLHPPSLAALVDDLRALIAG